VTTEREQARLGPVMHDGRKPDTMALFHSMFGLRQVELTAAERLRAAGHRVVAPDRFAGAVAGHGRAATVEDGFALTEAVGWDAIVERGYAAVRDLPAGGCAGVAVTALSQPVDASRVPPVPLVAAAAPSGACSGSRAQAQTPATTQKVLTLAARC